MRLSKCVLPLFYIAAGLVASAQSERPALDAEQDGYAGPVRSVTTTQLNQLSPEQQQKAPYVAAINCPICEYDRDGNKVTQGLMVDGQFAGETTEIVRDANGNVVERITKPTGGNFIHRELIGPFGKTDVADTADGKTLLHSTFTYDAKGQLIETQFSEQDGTSGREVYRWNTAGKRIERSSYGKDNNLSSHETWDPESDESRFSSLDAFGSPTLTWTIAHGQVVSFWAASDEPRQYGETFFEDHDNGEITWFHCHRGTECTAHQEYREYFGPGNRNIKRDEWRDSQGNLVRSVDFEYEFDSHRNWTHRKVWVVSPELKERTLYEEDSRTISYWDR